MPSNDELREELATATRILARHGMIGMFGHVSVLTEDPSVYLLCPGAGKRKDLCRPEDVLELGLDDVFDHGRPLELYMHAELHRARPDLQSLIHVHSPNLTALAALDVPPADLLMIHASFWPERIPLWERPELVTNHDMAKDLVALMGDSAVTLLRWHGAVIVGRTLREAVFRTVLAEYHAGIVLAALATERTLKPVEVERPPLYAKVLPSGTHDMFWRYESTFVDLPE